MMTTHHLDGTDILFLLHIDVCDVKPHITEISRGLTDLSKYVPSLVHAALMSQHSTCMESTHQLLDY
jgi:hypothetical protein